VAAEIAHILFVDIVGWSKRSMDSQAQTLNDLNHAIGATPSFTDARAAGHLDILPTGDGFAVLFFGNLLAPAQCALELSAEIDMPVRMGIHSGPITRHHDLSGKANFIGDGLNLAKRVLDFAEPGQILMSEAYSRWLLQFDAWLPLIHECGSAVAKHGVQMKLFSLSSEERAQALSPPSKKFVILYRRKAYPDEEVVHMLERTLPARGGEVFVDRHLKIGVEWARSIESRIREADAVVALLSDASMTSEMMEAELEIAYQARQSNGKPKILPVRIGESKAVTGPLAIYLSQLNYGNWISNEDNDRLVGELLKAMEDDEIPIEVLAEADTGGLSPDSPLYVERSTDAPFHQALKEIDSILLVKGPRQMGKTSLLARGVRTAEEMGARIAFTDFQKFSGPLLMDEDVFYRFLAMSLAKQIGFNFDFKNDWDPTFGSGMCLDNFVRSALEADSPPVIWFMDEADKLFTAPFASNFYGLVRSWHNSRATQRRGPWSKLTVVVSYATEAHLFIQDLNQSPFNVGRKFELKEFTLNQISALNARAGSLLKGETEVQELFELIGGQPFLVRRALNSLAGGQTFSELMEIASREDGPFGDHLKRLLVSVSRLEGVLEAVRQVLKGETPNDSEAMSRLVSSGIAVEDFDGPRMRNALYKAYLSRHLK
jgi:hypothetical protein